METSVSTRNDIVACCHLVLLHVLSLGLFLCIMCVFLDHFGINFNIIVCFCLVLYSSETYTAYVIKVSAVNAAGEGDNSTELTAYTDVAGKIWIDNEL